jgi:O-antigen/teichoic acid export membrane protein
LLALRLATLRRDERGCEHFWQKALDLTLLKRNIIAGYVGQIYVTVTGIVLVPTYVKYMGAEAYGLIGFYAMLQAWFMLLDMGLTPTMAREAARFRGRAVNAPSLRRLLRALEKVFVGIGILGAGAMMAGSGFIARSWLKVERLPLNEVQHALVLVGIIIALRWVSDLYRGVISGFEKLVWLHAFNMAIATLRFGLVILVFRYVGTSPTQFFEYQLVLAVGEVTVLVVKAYSLIPATVDSQGAFWDWRPLRGVLHFSLAIAFTSSVWVLAMQTDKLILSKLLPLSDFAYFTLAVLVASGVLVISVPISGALMPRMVALNAGGDEVGLIRVYRDATQLMAVIIIPATLVLGLFPEQVLWAWTGDREIARRAAPVLTLYAFGNGVMALSAFAYYLQFAKGSLKLHLAGSALFVVVLIPSIVLATRRYGVVGAGYAWLGVNAAYFLLWVPKVHRRFVRGLHGVWLFHDLAGIALATGLCAALARPWIEWPVHRAPTALLTVVFALGLLMIAGAASSWVRGMLISRWRSGFC